MFLFYFVRISTNNRIYGINKALYTTLEYLIYRNLWESKMDIDYRKNIYFLEINKILSFNFFKFEIEKKRKKKERELN